MSRTWIQGKELRFLYLGLAFVLALAALVAFPGTANADNAADQTIIVASGLADEPGLWDCDFPTPVENKWSMASFVFDHGDTFSQVCGLSSGTGWQDWYYQPPTGAPIVIHVSCSDDFESGYGVTGGPKDTDGFSVASYHITKGQGADCGDDITGPDPSSLTLVKRIVGGTADVDDFSIGTDAGGLTWTASTEFVGTFTSNTITTTAGTYTFWEADHPGYTEGSWICRGEVASGDFDAGSVVLGAGDDVICEITNTALARLTVVKAANAGGSFDFTLWDDDADEFVDEVTLSTGGSNTWVVPAGAYGLSEDEPLPAYWSLTDIDCPQVEVGYGDWGAYLYLGVGDDVTCTFTNFYDPPGTSTTTTTTTTTTLATTTTTLPTATTTTTTTTVPACPIAGLEALAATDDACTEVDPLVIETLPETGADTNAAALVAGLLVLMGGALVAGSHYRRDEGFTVERLTS